MGNLYFPLPETGFHGPHTDALLSVLGLQFTKFLESFKKIRLYFPRPQWYSITVYT
ncbi:hypothetical protein CLOSTASPAR_01840 [[Clostridium] asparagiforme DSM 15981]|uniref:Uncharacterized protein n=1 Tax=[Clostridium] asparagiforme DSM 15981 TaxID=518636 RepID=C0CXW4_9FIRM|nr:hypothetical protein CLOSTASPAR_01840 [[Clostridium] asparagiforme DSM 15981]